MSPPERSRARVVLAAAPVGARRGAVAGWGGGTEVPVSIVRGSSVDALQAVVAGLAGRPAIARGMGRSYGDAAQLRDGLVLDTIDLRAFELDPGAATVWAQAGVTLGQLLAALQPRGWVLPVVPGTQHVSVGGAIASDIHGKNHASAGTFGAHVLALGLLTASGEIRELTAEADEDGLMAATVGGMGLTGVILWAQIRLRPLRTPVLAVDTDRVETLDDALDALDAPGGSHRVAWLDLLGGRPVRAVVTRAEHPAQDPQPAARARTTVRARLTVPAGWPAGALRVPVVRAYNAARFRRAPQRGRGRLEPFGAHMFPLDVLEAWPRLYGPAGFVQYQLVVPRGQERALERVIAALRRSAAPCYLAVLKDLGPQSSAPLSFPMRGWTLAMDIPRDAAGLPALLDAFDEIVAHAGGRVYLAKDGRLRADTLAAMYPRLKRWRAIRDRIDPDRVWRSDLALRTGLVAP
ncbi:MAG: FAD-binding protein [Solirubrobacteraceae bacterium]